MSATSSAQDMVRPGNPVDIYYYDAETSKKQAFPTTVNTKYTQALTNLSSGTSVFTIPPNNGLQDIVVVFKIAALGAATKLSLNPGWGYSLINRVSFRYGGSSQYFLGSQQILLNALRKQPNRSAVNDILTLGGATALPADLVANDQYAAVVLTLPHNIPSGVGKEFPLPSDCLTQQVQVTVELNPVASIFSIGSGGGASTPPSQLTTAYFQVQQVMFNNAGDALARRVDMAENAYAMPVEFVQQEQIVPLANSAAQQSVVLTGFRSGEVKSLQMWITKDSDVASAGYKNPFKFYRPELLRMTYAGDIYAQYDTYSAQLWNLINGNKTPAFDNIVLSSDASDNVVGSSAVSYWSELPFAQTLVDEDAHHVLVHGKPITNGILNIDLITPTAAADYKLHVSYIYNATLLFSQGSCDYVF